MICLAVFKALAHGRCSQSCHQASAALTLMLMGMEARCYPGHWDGTRAKGIIIIILVIIGDLDYLKDYTCCSISLFASIF